jgi:hypothetical protein
VKVAIDTGLLDAEKHKKQTMPGLTTHVKVVKDQAPPERVPDSQGALNTLMSFLKTTMNECVQTETNARKLMEAEKKKIPPEILRGPAAGVISSIELLLGRLTTLNSENAGAARGFIGQSGTTVK